MSVNTLNISQQLANAIRESEMTHYALSKLSGVAPHVIDRFVSGERDIRLATAAKLANALGLTLTYQKPT